MVSIRRFSGELVSQFLSMKTLSISSNSIIFKSLGSIFIMLSVLSLSFFMVFLKVFLIRFNFVNDLSLEQLLHIILRYPVISMLHLSLDTFHLANSSIEPACHKVMILNVQGKLFGGHHLHSP